MNNRIRHFLMVISAILFSTMAFGALPVLWGTTPEKQNVLFIGTSNASASTLDQRLIKAIKASDILVLETPSNQGMKAEISQFFKNDQKSIYPLDESVTKADTPGLERLLKIIKDNPGKKIVVAVGLPHFDNKEGFISLLKKKRFTFTSFEVIPMWPVYIPHSHESPSIRKPKAPYKGAQIDKLQTIMPPRVPNPPLPPMPPIAEQPLTGLGSPFAREHFHHHK